MEDSRLVHGGVGSARDLESPGRGGAQGVQRLVRPDVKNESAAVREGAADRDGEGCDGLHLFGQLGDKGLPFVSEDFGCGR
ncbi:hypothetical protein [Streptomyces antimycoticus]|uniref:hypothetical protein n=1 Tax=Streptomyces antimycoticus TaxID=68175 RepID=UPI00117E3B8B|nr:hypothetical protein [Streptomyces antimycoticus]